MHIRLVKLKQLSGNKSSIYSIYIFSEQKTSFDIFLIENKSLFLDELNTILERLNTIGHKTGAREQFFKIGEGKPGDGVCALYDDPNKKLRLYCIRYGNLLVIVGGGGQKKVKTLQEDKKLKAENYFLRKLSGLIKKRMDDGEINFSDDYMDFEGNLEFNDEDYE
jgi:hypothetical protein